MAARLLIAQAVGAEFQAFMAQHAGRLGEYRGTVVRNGYIPGCTSQTGIGNVDVKVPKERDSSGQGIKFNSSLLTPYLKRARSIEELLPRLYLRGRYRCAAGITGQRGVLMAGAEFIGKRRGQLWNFYAPDLLNITYAETRLQKPTGERLTLLLDLQGYLVRELGKFEEGLMPATLRPVMICWGCGPESGTRFRV